MKKWGIHLTQLTKVRSQLVPQLKKHAEHEMKIHLTPEILKKQAFVLDHAIEFIDMYYDIESLGYPLCTNDIWLRRRNDQFECKIGKVGDPTKVQTYLELANEKAILQFLLSIDQNNEQLDDFKSLVDYLQTYQFTPVLTIHTKRDVYYDVSKRFEIVCDITNDGQYFGEVEIVDNSKTSIDDLVFFIQSLGLEPNKPIMGKVKHAIVHHAPKLRDALRATLSIKK